MKCLLHLREIHLVRLQSALAHQGDEVKFEMTFKCHEGQLKMRATDCVRLFLSTYLKALVILANLLLAQWDKVYKY